MIAIGCRETTTIANVENKCLAGAMSVRYLTYWLFHGVSAALLWASVLIKPFAFVGLIFIILSAALVLIMTFINRGLMQDAPALDKVAYVGLFALWFPTFAFGVWPDIHDGIAFKCLALIVLLGSGVTIATSGFLGRNTR